MIIKKTVSSLKSFLNGSWFRCIALGENLQLLQNLYIMWRLGCIQKVL